MNEHAAGEVVHIVLEAAADQEASADLLRAAAHVLSWLIGTSYICNAAIYGVRAGDGSPSRGCGERVYTMTDPVAVVAARPCA